MSEFIIEAEHRVTPFKLFFDLVFVFAFTEVTTLLLENVTWGGLARGSSSSPLPASRSRGARRGG